MLRIHREAVRPSTGEVWHGLRDDLLAFFRARVRDPHRAEDLLQETFLRIHGGLEGLRAVDRLVPWVYRVARSVLADQARAGQPAAYRVEALEDEPGAAADQPSNLNAVVAGWLPEMIAMLPAESREAVRLAEIDGRSQAQVAQELGLSLSGAKSRVQRGRAKLRELLLACCHLDLDRGGNVLDYHRKKGCPGCSDQGGSCDR